MKKGKANVLIVIATLFAVTGVAIYLKQNMEFKKKLNS